MIVRILIAEHETALGMFIARSLEKESHTVMLVSEAAAAASAIASADYDLFLLDMDLPGDIGMRVLEVVRQLANGMRVLVLSAKGDDLDTRIACLEGGADDCLTKPFAMRELKVRCRALVRRQDGEAVLRCLEPTLRIVIRGDALGNFERSEEFEYQRNLAKLGKPVDRSEWAMTPHLVNAVNLPVLNAHLRSKPVARSASSSTPKTSPTFKPALSHVILHFTSRPNSATPDKSK